LNGGRAKEIGISVYGMNKKCNLPLKDQHQLVLDAIRQGCRTWHEIVAATKLTENRLGVIFSDLFEQKKVKVEYQSGERRYRLL
jgi:hypothetical protein